MGTIFHKPFRAKQMGRQVFNLIVALALMLAAIGTTAIPADAGNKIPKADPRLLQMAAKNPNATFMVIVQRDMRNSKLLNDAPEVEVSKGGGRVKKNMKVIQSFSALLTGKNITKLAQNPKVRWISADAPMLPSTAGPGMDSVRDEFTTNSYSGNNGTTTWSTDWSEAGVSPPPGMIQVVSDSACAGGLGYCLALDPSSPTDTYLYRQADLSGKVSVWLSLYRDNQLNSDSGDSSAQVQLQVSSDAGASWTTLQTYSGTDNTGADTDSFDISAYASANTQIRFLMPTYQTGIRYIYFDDIEIVYAYPSAFLSAIKADQLSLNGEGITVAVVDSGIASHTDFMSGGQNRIIYNGFFGNLGDYNDYYEHGTHVAGIIGGNGAASNGKYKGVAPGVNLINLRVSDENGMTHESDLIAGLEWIYNNQSTYNIRVVNISINSTIAQSYQTSALDAAVEALWLNGIVVVVSSGNNGTGNGPVTVYPPANDPFVITVGATEDKGTPGIGDDNLAVFSAYSTTEDGYAKPDLVAPGRNLVAPFSDMATATYIAHPLHRVGDYYFRMSGTSMAAPVVSGAVALLLQNEPNLNPDQVKYRIKATANQINWGFDPAKDGAGYLDVYAAVNGTTTESANTGIPISQMLLTGSDPTAWSSVGWNSVGWNSVGWNSVGWNSVGWNSSLWDD